MYASEYRVGVEAVLVDPILRFAECSGMRGSPAHGLANEARLIGVGADRWCLAGWRARSASRGRVAWGGRWCVLATQGFDQARPTRASVPDRSARPGGMFKALRKSALDGQRILPIGTMSPSRLFGWPQQETP